MLVVSQFWWIGFHRAAVSRAAFSQSPIRKFHPALHVRPDHVAFTPHRHCSGMGENSHHALPQVITPAAFERDLGF